MKKITLLILTAFVINSWSTEENTPQVYYELLPIESCEVPNSFVSVQTYEMKLLHVIPTSCHFYKGIYFEKLANTRVIAVQSGVVVENTCTILNPGQELQNSHNQPLETK